MKAASKLQDDFGAPQRLKDAAEAFVDVYKQVKS